MQHSQSQINIQALYFPALTACLNQQLWKLASKIIPSIGLVCSAEIVFNYIENLNTFNQLSDTKYMTLFHIGNNAASPGFQICLKKLNSTNLQVGVRYSDGTIWSEISESFYSIPNYLTNYVYVTFCQDIYNGLINFYVIIIDNTNKTTPDFSYTTNSFTAFDTSFIEKFGIGSSPEEIYCSGIIGNELNEGYISTNNYNSYVSQNIQILYARFWRGIIYLNISDSPYASFNKVYTIFNINNDYSLYYLIKNNFNVPSGGSTTYYLDLLFQLGFVTDSYNVVSKSQDISNNKLIIYQNTYYTIVNKDILSNTDLDKIYNDNNYLASFDQNQFTDSYLIGRTILTNGVLPFINNVSIDVFNNSSSIILSLVDDGSGNLTSGILSIDNNLNIPLDLQTIQELPPSNVQQYTIGIYNTSVLPNKNVIYINDISNLPLAYTVNPNSFFNYIPTYDFAINNEVGSSYVATTSLAYIGKGSFIKTPNGEVLIENLKIGDFILTHDNRATKITDIMFYNQIIDQNTKPVIIRKGMYNADKDFYLSGNHCILINNEIMIMSKELDLEFYDNIGSIITYYLIKTENYFKDTMIANGVTVDTWGGHNPITKEYTDLFVKENVAKYVMKYEINGKVRWGRLIDK